MVYRKGDFFIVHELPYVRKTKAEYRKTYNNKKKQELEMLRQKLAEYESVNPVGEVA